MRRRDDPQACGTLLSVQYRTEYRPTAAPFKTLYRRFREGTHDAEPSAHIVPSDADNVPALESPACVVVGGAVPEEFTIPKAQVVYEAFISDANILR